MPASKVIRVVQSEDQKANLETQIKIPLGVDAIGSGNNGAVFVNAGSNVTFTVKDSGGTTWTKRQNVHRSGGQYLELWTRENITDAPTWVTIDASGSGSQYLSGAFVEACGVGAYDTGSVSNGTSTTPAVASYSPTAGALIVECAVQDSSATFLTQWAPGSGYTALCANLIGSFQYSQWRLHTSGATTGGSTMSASRGWGDLAISWLANTANGTAPSAASSYPSAKLSNSFDSFSGTYVFQLPSVGASSLGLECQVPPGVTTLGVTDTEGNTWVKVDTIGTTSGGTNEYWKTTNAIAGSNINVVSVTHGGSVNGAFFVGRRYINTPANPVSQAATKTSGTEAVLSAVTGIVTVPTGTGWTIVSMLGVQSHTVTAVSVGAFVSETSTPTVASPARLKQNNGYRESRVGTVAVWSLDGVPNDWEELNVIIDADTASASSPGSASGVSTVAAIGSAVGASPGSSTGLAAITGIGAAVFSAIGAAAGASTGGSTGISIASSPGSATGTAVPGAASASIASSAGAAAGLSAVTALSGAGVSTGAGSSAGQSVETATGFSIASAAAASIGTSTSAAVGSGTAQGSIGAAAGTATGSAGSLSIVSAAGYAAGMGTVLGSSVLIQRLQLHLSESVVTRLALSESLV